MTVRRMATAMLLTGAVLTAGCGSSSVVLVPGAWYRLYTHCGIEWTEINGTYWRTDNPLSDGHGNPPPGWGNPYQTGSLRSMSPAIAVFTSPAGSVTFHYTPLTTPPVVCS